MTIYNFSEYLQKLEATTKRLEITQILTEMIHELDVEEIDKALYLSLGYLKAAFESQKFNIADKMMIRVLEITYATPQHPDIKKQIEKLYDAQGDLGDVVYNLAPDTPNTKISVTEMHKKLMEIAQTEGTGSQDIKAKKLSEILKELDKVSAKYLTRIILGTTRLGFTETTVVQAIALEAGNKGYADEIEKAYNIHPDIGLIAKQIKAKGIAGIKDVAIETGVPILSQKAQRVSGMEEAFERIPNVWVEFKFDGTRVQLHLDRNKPYTNTDNTQTALFDDTANDFMVKTFTRNLEETTHQYPDIVASAKEQLDADSVILDGEAIGYDPKTGAFLPFQETIQRKRKHDVAKTAKNIPLKYFVFDILYLNGKPTIDLPLEKRHELLEKVIKAGKVLSPAEHYNTNTFEGLEEYYELAKEKKLEGVIVKKPEDPYQAGARSYSWIKLKKADEKLLDDSIDCVVLGYYAGKGNRSQFGIGGFLVGVYDEKTDTYKTISKVGTGLKENDWVKLKELADKLKLAQLPSNVQLEKAYMPDIILKPSLVVEIGADEISVSKTHTAGYALRFPRLIKFREDKAPIESTTLSEVEKMYQFQKIK